MRDRAAATRRRRPVRGARLGRGCRARSSPAPASSCCWSRRSRWRRSTAPTPAPRWRRRSPSPRRPATARRCWTACPRSILRAAIRYGTQHRALVGELLDVLDDRQPIVATAGMTLEPLTDREQSVLRYLPSTLSNREIAGELLVTPTRSRPTCGRSTASSTCPTAAPRSSGPEALGLLREVIRSG